MTPDDSMTASSGPGSFRAAVIALAEDCSAGVAALGVSAAFMVVQAAVGLETWVMPVLAGKPLLDLTWRWSLGEIFRQQVNAQAVLATFAIVFNGIVLVFRRRDIVLSKAVLAFLACALVSVVASYNSESINELIRLYAGVSFFFTAGIVLARADRFRQFAEYFLLAVSVPVVLCFFQLAGLLPYDYWDWTDNGIVGRASGTYQHPLGLIYFLIYAVPFALYLLGTYRIERRRTAWLWVFFGLAMAALVITYHRTALIAIGTQIWLWLLLTGRRRLAVSVAVLAASGMLLFKGVVESFYQPAVAILSGNVSVWTGEFLRGRGMQWYLFLSSWYSGGPISWLIGRGGSVAQGFVPQYGYWYSNEPHDDFIRILHAYGIIGLGLYLSLLISFLLRAWRMRRSQDPFRRHIAYLVIVTVVAVVIMGLTTEPMRFPTGVWYLFMLASVLYAMEKTAPKASPANDQGERNV